jgi:DNA-binding ferritin-like protein
MEKIAVLLRMAQLFAHNAHNLISGPSFFADHEFLGELYPVYESGYDSVVERMIGSQMNPNLLAIQIAAIERLKVKPVDAKSPEIFKEILKIEIELRKLIDMAQPGLSEGTKQMLGNLADDSEVRQYKLMQRIKV